MIRILEYTNLDTKGLQKRYQKLLDALQRGDFRSTEVKKLSGYTRYYRARLDDSNRVLFMMLRHGEQACVLILEIIRNHEYSSSRFLRGADVREERIADATVDEAVKGAQPLRYLHPERTRLHLLDKPLSFDDIQETVFQQAAPLIVVGSAGSGKTALVLEKLKQVPGDVLYITHSAYLAQSARDLYFAHGFARDDQQAQFLSYRNFLETIKVPSGREASWPLFSQWFARMQQAFRGLDAHQVWEEFRGVLSAQPEGVLDLHAYLALGVRQSIFAPEQREQVHALFLRYRQWLHQESLYDLNLLAHERLSMVTAEYDFVVVDEVQDLTMVQLALVLKALRNAGQFLLCGDSNQIVHPNFFSWSQVKTLFWRDASIAARQVVAPHARALVCLVEPLRLS